jgi:hypothetical protein
MMRCWVGAAVIAGCLGFVTAARAQLPPPTAQDTMPEPIPFCPQTPQAGPDMIPGPLNPLIAPHGPGPDLSLPNDGSGAFPCCPPLKPKGCCYFDVGAQMLMRQHPFGGPISLLDPQNLDTGNPPPGSPPFLQHFSDIDPRFSAGPRGTLGYVFDGNQAIEVSAYYLFETNSTIAAAIPGRIDSFFINPPLGFEGDNGLWLQADRMTTTLSSTLWSAEANYRCCDVAITGAELIAGVRYLDLDERLTNLTDDDGLVFPLANGQPDPTRVATYMVRTHNHLVAPQLGFEWERCLTCWLDLGLMAKGAWGVDFVDLDRQLVRGDGFLGFSSHRSETQFAQMYELNAFVDIHIVERCRVRLGYTTLWFANMANVSDQFDFNLQNTDSFNSRNGSVFFHGPMVEFQFLF